MHMSTITPENPVKMSDEELNEIGISVLHIPDHTGDTRVMWDPRVPDEVATARAAFNAAKSKGMTGFAVNPDTGEKIAGEKISNFDPEAGKIIMVKPLAGG